VRPALTGYNVDTLESFGPILSSQLYLILEAINTRSSSPGTSAGGRPPGADRRVLSLPGLQDRGPGGRESSPFPHGGPSASDIRARVARGEDLSGLVPPAVASYITRRRLYR